MSVTVIVPTIGKDWMIVNLINQIRQINDQVVDKIVVINNGMPDPVLAAVASYAISDPDKYKVIHAEGAGIYAMWNLGLAEAKASDYAVILNDDLILDVHNPSWFEMLTRPMKDENVWATCANYNTEWHPGHGYEEVRGTYKDRGFAGFCFAVKMKAYFEGLPLFDQNYYWWYGDDDFVHNVHRYGKMTILVNDVYVNHINGGSNTVVQYTPEFNELVAKDREYYMEKWHSHV